MTRRHVSAETMAGFRQGELSPRQNSRIGAHLAGCDRCRTLDEGLAGVSTLLAGTQPPPIPEHLATRIQTALATEAASRVARPAANQNGIGTAAPGNLRPARGPGWRPRVPQLRQFPRLSSRVALGSLAAAVAVLIVIGGAYKLVVSRGTGSASSGTAASLPASHSAARSANNGIAAPSAGRYDSRTVLRYRHSGHTDSIAPVTTDMDFSRNRLGTEVAAAVASYGTGFAKAAHNPSPMSGVLSPAPAPAERSATFGDIPVSQLQGCVNRVAAGEVVLLVDVARYRGTPATVIVTDVTVVGPEQIWVVGTGCSGSRSDMLTHATMAAP
jgi:hypothetical protein